MKLYYALFLIFPFLVNATTTPLSPADIMAENCAIAKNKLKSLTEKPRVRKMNARGELEVLPPEVLQFEIEKTKTEVFKYCGPKQPS